jgi:uncharacterized membrane protein YkoI
MAPITRAAILTGLLAAFAGAAHATADGRAAKPPAVAKITAEAATSIALKALPGKATAVTIETKRGKKVYVVEIMTEELVEKDVFVDMVSGKVLGID